MSAHRHRSRWLKALAVSCCVTVLTGCYEKVVRVKSGSQTREVSKQDFDEQPSPLDELMWGPVPKGQDPATYYRKKKQFLAQ